jgi:hypothetical protein
MNAQQIFGLQFVLSLVLYGLLARWYVAPRLAPLPLASALTPLLFLHASRFLGMVFLVPSVTGGPLPSEFARAAAYGDLLAALLAFASIAALRTGWTMAIPLIWLFNLEGTLDLINALVQGLRHNVQLGAAYYIPTVAVPALLVTHAMIFAMLLTKRG